MYFAVLTESHTDTLHKSRAKSRSPSPTYRERSRSPIDYSRSPSLSPRTLEQPSPKLPGSKSDSIEDLRIPKNAKKQPIEVLSRIFPHMKRNVLQLILQGCNNDVVQCIEHVMNGDTSTMTSLVNDSSLIPPYGISSLHNGASTSIKSAFSPIASMTNAHSLNSMRYAWGAMSRGLLPMPYSNFLPGFSALGASHPGFHRLSPDETPKPFPYMYPYLTTKTVSSKNDV